MTKRKPRPAGTTGARWTSAHLHDLIEEATVDAHDESEQRSGFYTMIEEQLALPFEIEILGVKAAVTSIDFNDAEEIVGICTRGDARQAISILDLPLPTPPPGGAEWIEAYRRWSKGR